MFIKRAREALREGFFLFMKNDQGMKGLSSFEGTKGVS